MRLSRQDNDDSNNDVNSLRLILVGSKYTNYAFDCVALSLNTVCRALHNLLTNIQIIKFFHNVHRPAHIFAAFGIAPLVGIVDTDVAIEAIGKGKGIFFDDMIFKLLNVRDEDRTSDEGESGALLLEAGRNKLIDTLGDLCAIVQKASEKRALMAVQNSGASRITFDKQTRHSNIASWELITLQRSHDAITIAPLVIHDDSDALLNLLPPDISTHLKGKGKELMEIVIDLGEHFSSLLLNGGGRLTLGNRAVDQNDLDYKLNNRDLSDFGDDNRAGIEGQLHRISCLRNKRGKIIGLTMRAGRHISGNSQLISDLLFGCKKSILFLGEPSSGKTTIVREVSRVLAVDCSGVVVVDTSSEIAGPGDIKHVGIGSARRMMVPTSDEQAKVMIECVQNASPEVMVIDEIGRITDVRAARTCKQRGVRLIASAHAGDLRDLVNNPELNGLIGVVTGVTVGEKEARNNGGRKIKRERGSLPIFDLIVEMKRGIKGQNEWRVILDVAKAVDDIIDGNAESENKYDCQIRKRTGEGVMLLKDVKA